MSLRGSAATRAVSSINSHGQRRRSRTRSVVAKSSSRSFMCGRVAGLPFGWAGEVWQPAAGDAMAGRIRAAKPMMGLRTRRIVPTRRAGGLATVAQFGRPRFCEKRSENTHGDARRSISFERRRRGRRHEGRTSVALPQCSGLARPSRWTGFAGCDHFVGLSSLVFHHSALIAALSTHTGDTLDA